MALALSQFRGRMPYASELYGVYQPLLGWKSRLAVRRFVSGVISFNNSFLDSIASRMQPNVDITFRDRSPEYTVNHFGIGELTPPHRKSPPVALDTFLGRLLLERISTQHERGDPTAWDKHLNWETLHTTLNEEVDPLLRKHVVELWQQLYNAVSGQLERIDNRTLGMSIYQRESVVAGLLNYLYKQKQFDLITDLFFPTDEELDLEAALDARRMIDPMETFDPKTELDRVSLSPLGIVHLFRQYFFEFATFLGPPVQHLWLSPGGTVELVEVSTRRTLIERSIETALDSIQKSEKSLTLQDELADAIKEENKSNTKFGVSVDTSASFGMVIFSSQVTTGTSYEVDSSNEIARENTHKERREQTDRVSSEIKRSFRSTFRTVSETTDTTSKRYVLENSTEQLVNYELRRKMRQVGVQVQDVGTQLCWQTYVDNPGDELGVGKLVHVAEPEDLEEQHPQDIPMPAGEIKGEKRTLTATWPHLDGKPRGEGGDLIPFLGEIELFPPQPGYIYSRNETILIEGDHGYAMRAEPTNLRDIPTGDDPPSTERSLQTLKVGLKPAPDGTRYASPTKFTVEVTTFFKPSRGLINSINKINTDNREKYANDRARQIERKYREELFKTVRERVKAASNIQPRKFEELREEERIVVYRGLLRQLLKEVGVEPADPLERKRTQHILSELIQSMFDVDKMLYFVAPEWWVPKQLPTDKQANRNPQDVGLRDHQAEFEQRNVVSWGGAKEQRPDNYYITEDSAPARLGSSLGWLLQLDGDNNRQAFLNAPWVKAVVPIRPGKESAALNWLTRQGVEGSGGLGNLYQEGHPGEKTRMLSFLKNYPWAEDDPLKSHYAELKEAEFTIHDAIRYLALRVKEKYLTSRKKVTDPAEPGSGYLPTDKVFERGFDPLQGGFQAAGKPFEVFDQWVEVLPTDQIVAVTVKYDPQTGLQIPVGPEEAPSG